jgi:hypothetical protein
METKETVRVGMEGDEGFFAFGGEEDFLEREDEEEDFLEREEGEGDFFESEWDFGLRIGLPLLRRRFGSILSPSKKIHSLGPLRLRNGFSSP